MGAEGDGGLLRFLIVIAFGLPAAEIKDKNPGGVSGAWVATRKRGVLPITKVKLTETDTCLRSSITTTVA
jgi:hypothetical protein